MRRRNNRVLSLGVMCTTVAMLPGWIVDESKG